MQAVCLFGGVLSFVYLGLAFRPLPDVESTLIRFNKARASTYTPYVDHIESFLQCKFNLIYV